MTSQRAYRSTGYLGFLGLGAMLLSPLLLSCDAVQPRPPCRAQMSKYAARYTMVGTPRGNCTGKLPSAEVLNLQYYRVKPNDNSVPPSLAIEPEHVFQAVTEAKKAMTPVSGQEFSQGLFAGYEPDDNDICRAATLSDTDVTIGTTKYGYKWTNVQMLVKPLANAIHFGAELTRTQDDCVADFKVSAAYPVVYCGDGKKTVMNEMGQMVTEDDPTTGKPVAAKCQAETGNGISPAFDLECDASPDGLSGSHLCVPRTDFPSLRK